jgi:hypothetical protein
MKKEKLTPKKLEFKTNLDEEEFNLDDQIKEILDTIKETKIKRGRPNVRERSKKRGVKYICEEMDKFKNK